MPEIKVSVSNYGRKFLYMRYVDPLTGKTVAKSTGTANTKEAIKRAAVWEAELREGRFKPASKVTWSEARQRYEAERLPALAPRTADKVYDVFNSVERLIGVDKLAKLNAEQLSRYQRKLREERNLSEATIKSHLAHLQAALNWWKKVGLLTGDVPAIEMPTRGKGGGKLMKGRPATREEFERMLSKIPDVVGKPKTDEAEVDTAEYRWRWFLNGLWFSGLRLGEALDLSWDEPGHITIDFTERFPMFLIPGDKQKSGDDQLLPIAPEFAEMLLSIPQDQRTGKVFKLARRRIDWKLSLLFVSKTISAIGEKAGVVVNQKPKKFASAHDLRRSFGERWSTRVMPATLQQMMRHADISTTMKFYVGQNGQKAAADIYAAFAKLNPDSCNTSRITTPEPPKQEQADSPQVQTSRDDTNGAART